ncbi:hypothetical protein ACLB2K_072355 [Fragaria x ananassa]
MPEGPSFRPPPPLIATASTRRSDLATLTFSPPHLFQEYKRSEQSVAREEGGIGYCQVVSKIKYLWLRRARIGRQGLITLLQGCKDLELLDVRECCGFDEEDEEIAKLAASISKFMCEGSRVGQGGGGHMVLYVGGGQRVLNDVQRGGERIVMTLEPLEDIA